MIDLNVSDRVAALVDTAHLTLELEHSSGTVKRCATNPDEYSFLLSTMWQELKPESASLWLSSNTLEGVRAQRSGTNHARLRMRFGESIKVRVKS